MYAISILVRSAECCNVLWHNTSTVVAACTLNRYWFVVQNAAMRGGDAVSPPLFSPQYFCGLDLRTVSCKHAKIDGVF